MNRVVILIVFACSLLCSACANFAAPDRTSSASALSWELVYRHDADGNPIDGAKTELFAAIRAGLPIRLAWGVEITRDGQVFSVEHSAEPVFLTIVNELEVVVQLAEHIAQRSYVDTVTPGFADPAVMWRGLMSTDGTFDAVWVNRSTGTEVRRYPQRAGIAWFAFQAGDGAVQPALELAVPGGVRRAGSR